MVTLLGYLISLVTVVVNFLLSTIMIKTTTYEKWSTKTKYNIRLASKLTLCTWLNTALLQFTTTWLFFKNYVGPGGLIYNQTLTSISTTLLPAALLSIHLQYQKTVYKRN